MDDPAIAIPNLLYTYAEFIDAGDFASAARLFRHATIVSEGKRISGDEAIIAMWRSWIMLHHGKPLTRHITTNPIIELNDDGQSATCRTQYTVLQKTDTLPLQPVISGRYRDTFRVIDGEWCFVERRYAEIDLTGDVSEHLLIQLAGDE